MTNRAGRRRRHRAAKQRAGDRRRFEALRRAAAAIGQLGTTMERAGKLLGEFRGDCEAFAAAWKDEGYQWIG